MVARYTILLALLPALASAFVAPLHGASRPVARRRVHMMSEPVTKPTTSSYTPSRSSSSESKAIVPVNPSNIETTATIAGATTGILLFGPLVGLVLGAAANYASKSESEAGEVARGVGKTMLDVYNYLAKINTKYAIGDKVNDATKTLVSKIKESDSDGTVDKIEESLKTTTTKISALNEEYDLVGKTKTALAAAVDLSTAAIEKAIELNDKYQIVDKTGKALGEAADKIKKQIDSAQS